MKNKNNKILETGFTLIEMLVVIGILAVLIGLVSTSFGTVQKKSRDSKRKSDLRQIQKAIELYHQSTNLTSFPADSTFLSNKDYCWTTSGANLTCTAGETVFMSKVPVDPDWSSSSPVVYYYSVSGLTYTLCACLENPSDPDGVASGTCGARTCSSVKKYQLTEP